MLKLNYLKLEETKNQNTDTLKNYDQKLYEFKLEMITTSNFEKPNEIFIDGNNIGAENDEYAFYFSFWSDFQFQKFVELHKELNFNCSQFDLTQQLLDRSIFENEDFLKLYNNSEEFKETIDAYLFQNLSIDDILDKISQTGIQSLLPVELLILEG